MLDQPIAFATDLFAGQKTWETYWPSNEILVINNKFDYFILPLPIPFRMWFFVVWFDLFILRCRHWGAWTTKTKWGRYICYYLLSLGLLNQLIIWGGAAFHGLTLASSGRLHAMWLWCQQPCSRLWRLPWLRLSHHARSLSHDAWGVPHGRLRRLRLRMCLERVGLARAAIGDARDVAGKWGKNVKNRCINTRQINVYCV